MKLGGNYYYYQLDGNKNVVGLIDEARALANRYEYGPFRALRSESEAIAQPFKFSSEYADSETGLIYYNYRYYNPNSSKWLKRDSIEEQGGVNLYEFIQNNSILYIDYLGLDVITPWNPSAPSKDYYSYTYSKKESGSSSSFFNAVLALIPKKVQFVDLSTTFPIAIIPPWGSVEATIALEGCVEACCHAEGDKIGQMGIMFSGALSLDINAEIGNIYGGIPGLKAGKSKKTGKHNGNFYRKGRRGATGSPYSKDIKGNLGNRSFHHGKIPLCKTEFDLSVALVGKFDTSAFVFHNTQSLKIGSCSLSGGCKWDFEYSSKISYTPSTAVGERGSMSGVGTVDAYYTIF